MTEETTKETYRPTLGEMSHTDPYTDTAFGETQTYRRGSAVAADGGRDPDRETEARDADGETLQDVDHTPPDGTDGAAPVYERGNEGDRDGREEDDR
jgi:hypothetical protein